MVLANTGFGFLSLQYSSSATAGAPKETKSGEWGVDGILVYILLISLKLNGNLIIPIDFLCQADGEHVSASPIQAEKQGDNAGGGSSSSSSSSDSGSSSSGNLTFFFVNYYGLVAMHYFF